MSRLISSGVLIRRASRKTCWPSTTSMPSALSAARIGISTRSTPSGSFSRPCSRSTVATLRATSSAMPASGWNAPRRVEMPARARSVPSSQGLNSWWCLRGRAEVPEHRLAAARQHREPDQLVHRPGADVGGGQVADVGEVEGEQAAEVGRLQRGLDPGQPLGAQAVEVDALLPVHGVGPVGADRHRITGFLGMPSESMPAAQECQVSLHNRSGALPAERESGGQCCTVPSHTRARCPWPPPRRGPRRCSSGQAIRAAREQRGLSLRELARRVNVSPSFVSQIELGKANPSVGTLYSLVVGARAPRSTT